MRKPRILDGQWHRFVPVGWHSASNAQRNWLRSDLPLGLPNGGEAVFTLSDGRRVRALIANLRAMLDPSGLFTLRF